MHRYHRWTSKLQCTNYIWHLQWRSAEHGSVVLPFNKYGSAGLLSSHCSLLCFFKLLQFFQPFSPSLFPFHCSHLPLNSFNVPLLPSLCPLSFAFLFLRQYKCLPLLDALPSFPSLDASFIGSTSRYWFSRHILNPSIRTWRFETSSFSPRLCSRPSLWESIISQPAKNCTCCRSRKESFQRQAPMQIRGKCWVNSTGGSNRQRTEDFLR